MWRGCRSIWGWRGPPYLSFYLPHASLTLAAHSCQHESGPHRGAGRGHVWSGVRLGLRWAQVQGWGQVVNMRLGVTHFGQPGFPEAEGLVIPSTVSLRRSSLAARRPSWYGVNLGPRHSGNFPPSCRAAVPLCSAELGAAVPSHSRARWGCCSMPPSPPLYAGVDLPLRASASGCRPSLVSGTFSGSLLRTPL